MGSLTMGAPFSKNGWVTTSIERIQILGLIPALVHKIAGNQTEANRAVQSTAKVPFVGFLVPAVAALVGNEDVAEKTLDTAAISTGSWLFKPISSLLKKIFGS